MSEKKKKGWKAAIIVVCLLLVLAGVAAVLWLAWTMPVEEAQALVEEIKVFAVERVVPIGTAVLAAVAVILAMLSPAVTKVKNSAERFSASAEAIKGEQTESVKTRQSVEAYKAQQEAALKAAIAEMSAQQDARLKAMEDKVDAACGKIENVSDRVDRLLERQDASLQVQLIETENRPDLVRSGHAEQIERIAGRFRIGGDADE